MNTEEQLGPYRATVESIGYVEVSEGVWNSASLLGCGGNVIVNVDALISQLSSEGELSDTEQKLLDLCTSAKEKGLSDLILYI